MSSEWSRVYERLKNLDDFIKLKVLPLSVEKELRPLFPKLNDDDEYEYTKIEWTFYIQTLVLKLANGFKIYVRETWACVLDSVSPSWTISCYCVESMKHLFDLDDRVPSRFLDELGYLRRWNFSAYCDLEAFCQRLLEMNHRAQKEANVVHARILMLIQCLQAHGIPKDVARLCGRRLWKIEKCKIWK